MLQEFQSEKREIPHDVSNKMKYTNLMVSITNLKTPRFLVGPYILQDVSKKGLNFESLYRMFQKELYIFESLYEFIQKTCTVF
jgi:hypothetical protein